MSRARNIKPGFFKNDHLAECEPLARLLFAGLWCEADREGRLEDRPKRLKADCLPYDDCDVDALLNQLASRGFIVRYAADGVRYIAIPEFGKHQNPHRKETASSIPAPDKGSPRTVPAPEVPEPARLIPDSPSLIPPSGEKQERSPKGSRLADDWQPSDADIDYAEREHPRVDWRRESLKFRNYWLSKAGKEARKTNWHRTWCNWLMNADAGYGARAGPGVTPSKQTIGLAGFLGVDPHDLANPAARTVVHAPDRAVPGDRVLAGPRRGSGG